jgi:maltose alpha-D-glucosyltransferase/alpha-amylase
MLNGTNIRAMDTTINQGRAYRFLLLFMTLLSLQNSFAQVLESSFKEDLWYKNALIYNLDVKTFKDSDGNGIGDFQGLVYELDYLKSLGVDVIWLAPFQPSPKEDDGYDVADFYSVDSLCGTPGDFADFMFQAHKKGIRVMMDIVINHTSDQHKWFKDSQLGEQSRYRKWYVWSKKRPGDWNKGMVFPGVQKETWSLDKHTGEYFYHRFYKFQPDLNYDNPLVRAESKRIMGYWLNQGIAGFRLDAVPFIIERAYTSTEKPEQDFSMITEFRNFVQWRKSESAILGEVNVLPEENKKYFGEHGEGMHMMFNFYVNQFLFYALATENPQMLIKALEETKDIPQTSQWVNFLRNHDEVDLGRLTPQQRQEVFNAFGPEKRMQLYDRGIRRRLAPMLQNNRKKIELAYSILLSLPGTPSLRYGDEIGMGDNLQLPERMAVRTPMQWSAETNAGFSQGVPFRPVINDSTFSYRSVNVEYQQRDPNSLLNWMEKMIRLRKECPEIGLGIWQTIPLNTQEIMALTFEYEGRSLIVVHNFSSRNLPITLPVSAQTKALYDLLTGQELPITQQQVNLALDGYGYRWFSVNKITR